MTLHRRTSSPPAFGVIASDIEGRSGGRQPARQTMGQSHNFNHDYNDMLSQEKLVTKV
uniref:Uncharacterized protein n=1 Tax=Oryza sativa subsp. japonica TaxID=39947 RepID=Q6AV04_ORYSJ|nr:hypothetical protein [Oryza sativa Japonica Group]AAT77338.1 hypothetical protein [Oryza sativa Japonica Group]